MEVLEYPYRVKFSSMLMAGGFFGLCAAGASYAAITNDRGLIINGLIELSVRGAIVFWWVVAALSLGFVVLAIAAVTVRGAPPVRLTPTELSAPKFGFSRRPVVIPLTEVASVDIFTVQRQSFIAVATRGGKQINIARSMLPDTQAFETLHHALATRVRAGQR
jgi:hypothetical protein